MPMGIVSDEDFESEVSKMKETEVQSLIVIEKKHGGRPDGTKNIPPVLRKVIGEECIESGGNHVEIAEAFGVSKQAVAAYAHGATSCRTYNRKEEDLANHINNVKTRISTRAQGRLSTALALLTKEKMKAAKPTELAAIADKMASVAEKMSPQVRNQQNNIIIMAPERVENDGYGTTEV